jgi:pimeloyl-ACP methyl ester carboxylesterase
MMLSKIIHERRVCTDTDSSNQKRKPIPKSSPKATTFALFGISRSLSKLMLLLLIVMLAVAKTVMSTNIDTNTRGTFGMTMISNRSTGMQSTGDGILETANNMTAITDVHYDETTISQSAMMDHRALPTIFDWMRLVSPNSWLGILEIQDRSIGSTFSFQSVCNSIGGVLIPYLVLWIAQELLKSKIPIQTPHWLLLCWISPWSLTCYQRILSQLGSVLSTLHFYRTGRAVALESAITTLQERIQKGRAYRTRKYDVYLPVTSQSSLLSSTLNQTNRTNQNTKLKVLLFFPGLLIPHTAYSEVASRLSDAGFVVVVMSMEPLRLAYHRLGTDRRSIQRVMRDVTKDVRQLINGEEDVAPLTTVEWTLMGHSMGAFAAMKLFDDIHDSNSSHGETSNVSKKLVVWGMAAFVGFVTDLSHHSNAEMVVVQGTNDHLRDMLQSKNGQLEAHFPTQTYMKMISGGTHDGFGSYSFPAAKNRNSNSTALNNLDLERIRQQEEACRITIEFLT